MTILYHHNIDPATLDVQLKALSTRYNFVELLDCVDALRGGRMHLLPPKPLVLTLDDGCKENYELLEVFRRHGIRPTIFLSSGVVGTRRGFWWSAVHDVEIVEQLKRVPDMERVGMLATLGFSETGDLAVREALSRAEIEEMRGVVDFQAHTIHHPILTQCDDERSWREIHGCKEALERDYGLDIYAFAYPNGDYSEREVGFVVGAGYLCAVTTEPGLNGKGCDPYALRRVHLPIDASETEAIVRACVLPTCLRYLARGLSPILR